MINIKKATSAFSVMLLCLGINTTSAFASQPDETRQLISDISEIEHNLAPNGTSVETELAKLIKDYQEKQEHANLNPAEKVQLDALINQVRKQLTDYMEYKTNSTERGRYDAVYSPAVAAAVAAFASQQYILAAELLTHAQQNSALNSHYSPVNGDRVTSSPIFQALRKSSTRHGSAEFPNSGNTIQRDLYYAIKKFDWSRTGSYITITDRYDFGKRDLDSVEGVAIEIMYQAQQAGVLVPYYVSITRQ